MNHKDFDAFRNSTLDRKKEPRRRVLLSLTRDNPPQVENLYGHRRKGSSAIARVVFVIILLHVFLVGGTCVYKKLCETSEPAVASEQAPPPAPVITKTPLPSAISTADNSSSLASTVEPVPTLPDEAVSSTTSDIHITTAPVQAAAEEELVAVELPEEETTSSTSTTASQASTSAVSSSYTVEPKDLWGTICKKHGVDSKVMQAANPQVKDINKIVVGMVLTIPAKGSTVATAKPVATTKPVVAAKPAETAKPATTSSTKVHTVVSGDKLGIIAKKHGTTVEKLCELNNIKLSEAGKIRIGQKIKLP